MYIHIYVYIAYRLSPIDLYMIGLEVRHGLINHYEDFLSRPWQEHAQSTFSSMLCGMICVAFTLNLCVVSD